MFFLLPTQERNAGFVNAIMLILLPFPHQIFSRFRSNSAVFGYKSPLFAVFVEYFKILNFFAILLDLTDLRV